MGKSLMIAIAISIVIMGGVYSQVTSNTYDAHKRIFSDTSKRFAEDIAHSGLSGARQMLFDAYKKEGEYSGPTRLKGDYNQGDYKVDITTSDSLITFHAIGEFYDAKHNIKQHYAHNTGIPDFLDFALSCGRNMNINSGLNLVTLDKTLNASLFSNGNFNVDPDSRIEGFGFFSSSTSFDLATAQMIFHPNVNPNNAPVLQQRDSLDIPMLNPNDYLDVITKRFSGKTNLRGNYTLGTKTEPAIWYVDGNLTTVGPVTFSGYGAILVNGKVNIKHDFIGDYTPGEMKFALYAAEGIVVTGGVKKVAGQWFSNDATAVAGGVDFYGSITMSNANCNVARPFDLTYIPVSAELSRFFWKGDDTMKLVLSKSW